MSLRLAVCAGLAAYVSAFQAPATVVARSAAAAAPVRFPTVSMLADEVEDKVCPSAITANPRASVVASTRKGEGGDAPRERILVRRALTNARPIVAGQGHHRGAARR